MASFPRWRTLRRAIVVAAVAWLPAPALSQNVDFGITDDESYDAFIEAVSASEFVRFDYTNNPRPRVAGVVAALMEFATRNPLANEAQLTDFTNIFAVTLLTAAPGDPELRRSANFLPALRHTTLKGVVSLRGLDTNIGEGATALLGIRVPDPFDFQSLQSRMVRFEDARWRTFAHSPQWSNLLVTGLLGRDLNGVENPALANAMRAYLTSEGYEPTPDGFEDERFAGVLAGLAELPPDYDAFMAAITPKPGESVPPVWSEITEQFDAINDRLESLLNELAVANAEAPSLREGLELYDDEEILEKLAAEVRALQEEASRPRTMLAANTLLLHQSQDPSIKYLARQTQQAAEIQSGTIDMLAVAIAGLKIVGGIGTVAGGLATMVAAGWTGVGAVLGGIVVVGGAAVIISNSITVYDEFNNAAEPSSAEVQIFDQIVAVRQGIESLRVEMHERFDRIETQLNIVFVNMVSGFNMLGDQISDLQNSVDNVQETLEDITRDILINRAALERIEDALYGMAENLLHADLAQSVNTYLHYRQFNGVDLPYAGSESFLTGANAFFTFTVDTAQNSSLAGPHTSNLTVATADQLLRGDSIGRNVNDLRVFPSKLGLPRLASNRLVATAQWAQGAAGYAQLARENPWYFAYQYEQQILSDIPPQDWNIERMLREGRRLADAMEAGRSQDLFDALFDGYRGSVDDMKATIDALALAPRNLSNGQTSVDPWGPVDQDVRALAPAVGSIPNLDGLVALSLPESTTGVWDLFQSPEPELAATLAGADGEPWGRIAWNMSGSTLRFVYESVGGARLFERKLVLGGPLSHEEFRERWNGGAMGLRQALLSTKNLTGTSYGGVSPVTILTDETTSGSENWTERASVTTTATTPNANFSGNVAIDGDTMIVPSVVAFEGRGAAQIFTRTGPASWALEETFSPDALTGDPEASQFGTSVAVSGDTAVVGAPVFQSPSGGVWVFTRSGSTWSQQTMLVSEQPLSGSFGSSLAIDGDTLVIGDWGVSNNAGVVHVYIRDDSAWSLQQILHRPGGDLSGAQFGGSVDLCGDTLIVGALGESSNRGAAYVFTRAEGVWTPQGPSLLAADGATNHRFGSSVAIDGGNALIGAPSAPGGGAAYFFALDPKSGVWSQTSKITSAVGMNFDDFGDTVGLDGGQAVIGAPGTDGAAGSNLGAIFFTTPGVAGALQPMHAMDATNNQLFGVAVAISGATVVAGWRDLEAGFPAVRVFQIGSIEPDILRGLELLQSDVLHVVVDESKSTEGSNPLRDATKMLSNWEALLSAYATFSLPFAMETSDVLRAAFGGSPVTGEVCLRGEAILPISLRILLGQMESDSLSSIMYERAAIAQDEIDDALDADPQGHAYLNYMLAELRSLRDNAFNLAVPDTYAVAPDEALVVNSLNGLLANDVGQSCRTIEVDTEFHFDPEYIAPQHGHVVVYSNGSFTYTPDPGFVGIDSFTYRAGAFVNGLGCQPGGRGVLDQHVFSDPADVVILVGTAQASCPADLNGDGVVNAQDLGALLGSWGVCPPSPAACAGDTNGDGIVNSQDLSAILGSWGACGK